MNTKYSFATRSSLLRSAYINPAGRSLTASQVYELDDAFRLAAQKAKKDMVPQCTRVDEAKHFEELLLKHLPNPESIASLTLGGPTSPEERAKRSKERLEQATKKLAKARASIPQLEKAIEKLQRDITVRPAKVVHERTDPCSRVFPVEANPLAYSDQVTTAQLRS